MHIYVFILTQAYFNFGIEQSEIKKMSCQIFVTYRNKLHYSLIYTNCEVNIKPYLFKKENSYALKIKNKFDIYSDTKYMKTFVIIL